MRRTHKIILVEQNRPNDGGLENIDIIIHTAALHAPHVGLVPDPEFQSINVDAAEKLALAGVKRFTL